MTTPKYRWCIKTAKFPRIEFWDCGTDENPLDTVPDFDKGKFWSVDCKDQVDDYYDTDPEDNSFVLVPKTDILKVWRESV